MVATATYAGAATSQTAPSGVLNRQLQLGDVFAEQRLNVVNASGQTTAVATAVGNSLSGAVETGRLELDSEQRLEGDVGAVVEVTAAGTAGNPVTLSAQAVGNTGDAGAYGADMDARVVQTTGAVSITADATLEAPAGRVYGGGAVSATAVANSQAFGLEGGSLTAEVDQRTSAVVQAQAGAVVQYAPTQAVFSAAAAGNNVSSAGENGTQALTVSQLADGNRVQASTFVSMGNGWNAHGAATAAANNVAVTDSGPLIGLNVVQANQAYVRGEAVVNIYDFGLGSAHAFGVGNSVLAGAHGPAVDLDLVQTTIGGVEVIARYTGHAGWDAYSSATAIGNAATGYACSDCAGRLSASSRQTNNDDVVARSSLDVTGSNRSSVSTATAVGNSGTFFVTRPGS